MPLLKLTLHDLVLLKYDDGCFKNTNNIKQKNNMMMMDDVVVYTVP